MDVSKLQSAQMMVFYIRCAAILHNLLLNINDDCEWDTGLYDFDSTESSEGDNIGDDLGYTCAADRRGVPLH